MKYNGFLRESTCAFEFLYELTAFFINYFLFKKMTDRQMTIIHTWLFGRHFIENEKVSLSQK